MYVITGATSNTGSLVAHHLLDAGQPVRVIGRSLERLAPFLRRGAEGVVAEPMDVAALTTAFQGATAAWIMLQPNYIPDSPDFPAYQAQVTRALTEAIAHSQLPYAVTLSSWGADQPTGTGPVGGLQRLEQQLNALPGLHVRHLRAGYFMENTLAYIAPILAHHHVSSPFNPDLALPFVATRDISQVAAETLRQLAFHGQSVREIQGQRDLSSAEAAAIVGQAIGLPDLRYRQSSVAEFATSLRTAGVSENVTGLMAEVVTGINSGHLRTSQPRSAATTTSTSFEQFVADTLAPAYQRALLTQPLSK
jgi:uncharacterized protein YbjT (DUF2867 family)